MVVMTTEVLRNMLYERSDTLTGLVSVVMDEVHYLQDPYRGAVWEEVLIHLPLSVTVVCLSATISNAEEFGEWIGAAGRDPVIIEDTRPVPLEHHYLVGHRLHPMHVDQDGVPIPNPYVISLDQNELRTKVYHRRSSGYPQTQRISRPREGHRRVYVPKRRGRGRARGARHVAGDLLRLQPGRLRPQRAVDARGRGPPRPAPNPSTSGS